MEKHKEKIKRHSKLHLCTLQVWIPVASRNTPLHPDNVFIRQIQRILGLLHTSSNSELIPYGFKILENRVGTHVRLWDLIHAPSTLPPSTIRFSLVYHYFKSETLLIQCALAASSGWRNSERKQDTSVKCINIKGNNILISNNVTTQHLLIIDITLPNFKC
jgi:hypothetical protein